MEVPDLRSSTSPEIRVDLSPIYEAVAQRGWLLAEQYIGNRPGYDELIHDVLCNLSSQYQAGKSDEEVARLKNWGCDRGCVKDWKEKTRLLSIAEAERESLARETRLKRKEDDEGNSFC